MANTFDINKAGKHFFDLSTIAGEISGKGINVQSDFLCCINNGAGPTVLLCAGIHGDEYEPQTVLRHLAESLETEQITGRLIIIPAINYPAAQSGARVSPVDGQNMNRVFPGKADGTPTERLAAFITREVFPSTDLLIDAHTGGNDINVVPMIFGFSSESCKVSDAELTTIMEAWGYRYVQHVTGVDSTICGAALAANIASVEIEGGGGVLRAEELSTIHDGVLRALTAAGVLQTLIEPQPFTGLHVNAGPEAQLLAPQQGVIEHLVSLGDSVTQGEPVALLYPLSGKAAAPRELAAPVSGVVLRQARSAYMKEGQLVMNLGVLIC
ncbi:succinylglutamate desuccinylase/aspartoacylase family protein [Rouxiella sp. T17]|uniref:succinylglutamate desuccinylase/aspartoacylase domain-containing protein n=1 Tax=Rouxiella sp. T17 TaxID=3085684 RepID=UPI002FC80809